MSFPNALLTRGHAASIIFLKEYTTEDAKECLSTVEKNPIPVDICYANDPFMSVLLPSFYVNAHPTLYHRYPEVLDSNMPYGPQEAEENTSSR